MVHFVQYQEYQRYLVHAGLLDGNNPCLRVLHGAPRSNTRFVVKLAGDLYLQSRYHRSLLNHGYIVS